MTEAEQTVHTIKARVGSVVLNYDSPDDTLAAVESLMGSTYLDQHIVVVDNSTDELARRNLREALPSTASYLTAGENLGYAAGNNLGIRYLLDGGVEHVVLLNPDARVLKGTVDGLVKAANRFPDAGIIGPRLLHGGSRPEKVQSDGGRVVWQRGGATEHVNGDVLVDGLPVDTIRVDYVTGACVLLRARMLEDIGMIPEEYFLYYEETEFAMAARAAGWSCIVDRSIRANHYRVSTGYVPSRAYIYYMTRNRAVFANRHASRPEITRHAFEDLDETFLIPWSERVEQRVPELFPVFRQVVEVAKEHGISGRTGHFAELSTFAVQGVKGWEA